MEMFCILIWVVVPYKNSSYYIIHLRFVFLTMYKLYFNNPLKKNQSKKKLSNKREEKIDIWGMKDSDKVVRFYKLLQTKLFMDTH